MAEGQACAETVKTTMGQPSPQGALSLTDMGGTLPGTDGKDASG